MRLSMAVLLVSAVPSLATAQSLARQVTEVRDGLVSFTFASRPGVCGNGRDFLRDGFLDDGYVDVVRPFAPGPEVYTYWDYYRQRFERNRGMRIDFVLGNPSFAKRVTGASIDREERAGTGASDHAPVIVDLDEAPDGDCGPVVPPPSASRRAARR